MLSGTAGRLKDIEGGKPGWIGLVIIIEFRQGHNGRIDHKGSWLKCAYRRADHGMTIHITERKLLILRKIIIHNNRPEVMDIHKTGKRHSRLCLKMKIEVFYKERNAQQLVQLRKSEHVNRNE